MFAGTMARILTAIEPSSRYRITSGRVLDDQTRPVCLLSLE